MEAPSYKADVGGRFSSDVHRRVLGHLSHPDDDYGWSVPALFARMVPDVGTDFHSYEELQAVLNDLAKDGLADTPQEGVWRMTLQGLGRLLEGPTGQQTPGPAGIHGGRTASAATKLEDAQ